MKPALSEAHRSTYDALFRLPLPRDVQWRDVWSMLGGMSATRTVQENTGTLKVTRNGRTLLLHRPRGKELADAKELTQVRNFLERSGGAHVGFETRKPERHTNFEIPVPAAPPVMALPPPRSPKR